MVGEYNGLSSAGAATESVLLAGLMLVGEWVPKGCTDSLLARGCELRVVWAKLAFCEASMSIYASL